MTFDKRQTNIAKGLAVLMLLWHHVFLNKKDNYEKFISVLSGTNVPIECYIADFCKVCVAVFLLLSGYGLYKSYEKITQKYGDNGRLSTKNNCKFVWNHYIKMMSGYWFIYIIFVPMGLLFGRSFLTYYGINPIRYLADFFGVSYLIFDYSGLFNLTWWFMTIIIVMYIVFPLLIKLLNWNPIILLIVSVFVPFCSILNFRELNYWLTPFVFGMLCSHFNMFEKINKFCKSILQKIILSFLLIIFSVYLRSVYLENRVYLDSMFAFSIICSCYLLLSYVPYLNCSLEILGRNSGNIFMFHTFIYNYYFSTFIYCFKYSLLIYIVLVVLCLVISIIFEKLKEKLKYNWLLKKILISYS